MLRARRCGFGSRGSIAGFQRSSPPGTGAALSAGIACPWGADRRALAHSPVQLAPRSGARCTQSSRVVQRAAGEHVRLRAKSVEDLRPWLEALRPGCSTQESIQEVVTDVCLQVDTIFGVPKLREPDPEQTCAYFMRARWMGETMEIRAKSCHPEPGSTPYVDNGSSTRNGIQMACASIAAGLISGGVGNSSASHRSGGTHMGSLPGMLELC
ncbi:unnamed protein product [Prorocentrum cordatum]|uniref:PH domain-containing protein n=1 Tax=Prorocentrum cordatum TaxID=2364126 RepID=A0ABN9U1Y0_9DINO|nr:unnamed protein product [Polarella glacialis]